MIDNFDLHEVLSNLPPFELETIELLVKKNGEEKAAEIWINSNGPREIKHFGGDRNSQLVTKTTYWERFKNQIDAFICGSPEWEKERTQAEKLGQGGIIGLATFIAQTISSAVGIAVPILVPPVVLILHVISKAGIKAYCANRHYPTRNELSNETEETTDDK